MYKAEKARQMLQLRAFKACFHVGHDSPATCFWVLLVRACKAVNCSKTREAISTQPAVLTKEFCNIVPLVLSFPTYLWNWNAREKY